MSNTRDDELALDEDNDKPQGSEERIAALRIEARLWSDAGTGSGVCGRPLVLMRNTLAEEGEWKVAAKHFPIIGHRGAIPTVLFAAAPADGAGGPAAGHTLVIPRYSALPYYRELAVDVELLGGQLINSVRQHNYVADIGWWYYDFEDLTPKTWMRVEDVPMDAPGPFVLKGRTNSRKGSWSSLMYAHDRARVMRVFTKLLDDPLLSAQGIVVRQFEDFVSYGTAAGGAPITREFRFFILDGEILAGGFYWSEHYDWLVERGPGAVLGLPDKWVRENICPRVKDKIRFVVADVAQRADGQWRLVELNDGCMSGLGMVDPEVLYSRLAECLLRS